MRGVKSCINILGGAAGNFAKTLAGDRGGVFKVLALDGGDPFTTDVVLVTWFEVNDSAIGIGVCVDNHDGYLSLVM